MAAFSRSTDQVHEIRLDSSLSNLGWDRAVALVGDTAALFVNTHFVGDGSEIEIRVEDGKGRSVEKIKGKVYGDRFGASLVVPKKAREELRFTARLPRHGLEMKSGPMRVLPLVRVSNMRWDRKEARRGDRVKMTADVEGLPDDIEVMLLVYEFDRDGAHDFVTKFPARVQGGRIEAEWEFEYHEDTDEIPTDEEMRKTGGAYRPPEYFWTVEAGGTEFGRDGESGLLEFKDWVEVRFSDAAGKPITDRTLRVRLPDGSERSAKTDAQGSVRLEDVPPGKIQVRFESEEEDEEEKVYEESVKAEKDAADPKPAPSAPEPLHDLPDENAAEPVEEYDEEFLEEEENLQTVPDEEEGV